MREKIGGRREPLAARRRGGDLILRGADERCCHVRARFHDWHATRGYAEGSDCPFSGAVGYTCCIAQRKVSSRVRCGKAINACCGTARSKSSFSITEGAVGPHSCQRVGATAFSGPTLGGGGVVAGTPDHHTSASVIRTLVGYAFRGARVADHGFTAVTLVAPRTRFFGTGIPLAASSAFIASTSSRSPSRPRLIR